MDIKRNIFYDESSTIEFIELINAQRRVQQRSNFARFFLFFLNLIFE